MNTGGLSSHRTGNVRYVGGRMAKMVNYTALLFAIAMFAIVPSQSLAGTAFAINQGGSYSHSHETATWDHGLVCGDHKCTPGEMPQHPPKVVPVKGIQ